VPGYSKFHTSKQYTSIINLFLIIIAKRPGMRNGENEKIVDRSGFFAMGAWMGGL
jgi:hypothetical protein